jgi:DNA-binding CsgD family transcriptional regulator
MPVAVRQHCRIFSMLALALLLASQYLGICITAANHLPQPQVGLLGAVFVASTFICALLLPLLSSRGKGFLAPMPILLTLFVATFLAGHVLGRFGDIVFFFLRAVGMGVFCISALYAFFLVAPPGRQGFLLGLSIAVAELIWLAMMPGLSANFSNAFSLVFRDHLHNLQVSVQSTSGLLLAYVFAARTPGDVPREAEAAGAPLGNVLPLLFGAAALFYIAYGVGTGFGFPKVRPSGALDSSLVFFLFAMPLAGGILDQGGRGCRQVFPVLAVLALASPIMVFTTEGSAREVLNTVLGVGRQGLLLATLLLADRLGRNRKQLLFALAYSLPTSALAGAAATRMSGGATATGGIALALALVFILLVMRLRGALADLPAAQEAGPTPPIPEQAPDQSKKISDFAAAHVLTPRERDILMGLLRGASREEMAQELEVAPRTVRHHLAGLLKKANRPNEKSFLYYYHSWKP